jgi:DNA invertase Pin-like site-specific DNA recombinase
MFVRWDITLEFVEGNLCLKTPEDLLMFWIRPSIPEVENRRRAENTIRGLSQGLREGRWMSKAPIGYKNNTQTGLVDVDEVQAANYFLPLKCF